MEDRKDVPYIAFESVLAREEREKRRLINIIILLIVCWMITIGVSVWYFSLPVEEMTSQVVEDVDSSSINQSIGE